VVVTIWRKPEEIMFCKPVNIRADDSYAAYRIDPAGHHEKHPEQPQVAGVEAINGLQ